MRVRVRVRGSGLGLGRACGTAGRSHEAAKHSAKAAIRMFIMHSVPHMK